MKRSDLTSIIVDNILLNSLKDNNAVLKGSSKVKVIDVQISHDVFYQIVFDLVDKNLPIIFLRE